MTCGPPEYDCDDMNRYYAMVEKRMQPEQRYFLMSDNDGHWYVVKEQYRKQWEEWLDLDSEDERAWTPPGFAMSLGCSPTCVTFTDPQLPK
jgi:hypothetical protein